MAWRIWYSHGILKNGAEKRSSECPSERGDKLMSDRGMRGITKRQALLRSTKYKKL